MGIYILHKLYLVWNVTTKEFNKFSTNGEHMFSFLQDEAAAMVASLSYWAE
ncbi:hypothetical protein J2Z65_007054 [Paenibacillus aceris]|uniref:Uncharacterized protein n=1 Tax=Paenibacillus aceris TaxID=869555 RepID=A0ABS4IAS0_9BACL|nr:hypothetical protein [Paenibacillus aceris]